MLTFKTKVPGENDHLLKMVVLVRREILPLVHAGVQAGHAVAEFIFYHPNENTRRWVVSDRTLIYLEATEKEIHEMMEFFASKSLNYQPFYEPDMGNALTAVAFQPIETQYSREIFRKFRLLK